MKERTVRFLTRRGCPLCDEALPIVERVAARLGFAVVVEDIDSAGRAGEYGDRVPVVLSAGGRVVAGGRFGRARLWCALLRLRAARSRPSSPGDGGNLSRP
jgi:hypothetical protein